MGRRRVRWLLALAPAPLLSPYPVPLERHEAGSDELVAGFEHAEAQRAEEGVGLPLRSGGQIV